MSIIVGFLEILAALAIAFVIAVVVYGIISTIFTYNPKKEIENLMNNPENEIEDLMKRNREFYDDDYEDMY